MRYGTVNITLFGFRSLVTGFCTDQ